MSDWIYLDPNRTAIVPINDPPNPNIRFVGIDYANQRIAELQRWDLAKVDVIDADGHHTYWSTHCRHDNHDACQATELAPGVPRQPAQCKNCGSPCICLCHK